MPPPIKVAGDRIIEGNHRYIAGRLFGQEPAIAPGTQSLSDEARPVIEWSQKTYTEIDYNHPK